MKVAKRLKWLMKSYLRMLICQQYATFADIGKPHYEPETCSKDLYRRNDHHHCLSGPDRCASAAIPKSTGSKSAQLYQSHQLHNTGHRQVGAKNAAIGCQAIGQFPGKP